MRRLPPCRSSLAAPAPAKPQVPPVSRCCPLIISVSNRAGMYRIRTNAVGSELNSRILREQPDATLRSRVRASPRAAHKAGRGRYVDDRAAARIAHRSDRMLGAQKHAFEIDVDYAVPLFLRSMLDWHPAVDRRIVHQYVQLAERIHGLRYRRLPVVGTS